MNRDMLEYVPNEIHLRRDAEARELDALLPSDAFSENVRKRLYEFALIRNSWGTTNIDAGPVGLERVEALYEAYRRGAAYTARILPTEQEILNYFRLVDDLPTERFDLSVDDLRGLHRDYFRDVPLHNKARPGQWKEAANVVDGPFGRLETTAPDRVVEELQHLLDWLNAKAWELPVIARAGLFFHRFQQIHPFADGNGRVGRLATLWVLSSGGLPSVRLCPIDDSINEDREHYYVALRAADRGEVGAWIDYFSARLADGYGRAKLLADRLQLIPSNLHRESTQLLEYLYVHKVQEFRPSQVKPFFPGVPRRTLRRRLAELEERSLILGAGRGEGRRYQVRSLHDVLLARNAKAWKAGTGAPHGP